MCLLTNRIYPKRAKRDIVVYKVFLMQDENSDLLAPFQQTKYPTGTTEITAKEDIIKSTRQKRLFKNRIVNAGYIHCLDTHFTASLLALRMHIHPNFKEFFEKNGYNTVIWKCVIPKGTLYFEDNGNSEMGGSIAAKKIRLEEIYYAPFKKSEVKN
jgi:hypothetical protein